MQSVPGASARPPGGEDSSLSTEVNDKPLSAQQRTALESLITRIIALTQQQRPEVWAAVKHALNIPADSPVLGRHFPVAEQELNRHLELARQAANTRYQVQQLSQLLQQGNNRQAVSAYIRQHYGQSVLSQLTPAQIGNVLNLLQTGQLAIPDPQIRPATSRHLLPAEHFALGQAVSKLAASTGETPKSIWQAMLALVNRHTGDAIPVRYYPLFTSWLLARQSLAAQSAPTLNGLQTLLRQPMNGDEWRDLSDFVERQFHLTCDGVLTPAQGLASLTRLFHRRADKLRAAEEVPMATPEPEAADDSVLSLLRAHPGFLLVVLMVALFVTWRLL